MLNNRNANIGFIAILIMLLIANIWNSVPLFIYTLLIFLYSLVLFYGCYHIGSNFFLNMNCYAKTSEKIIAISFDDGPVQGCTQQVLEILGNYGVKATFFCIGKRIEGNEELFRQIHEDGHVIGNHSHSHHLWFDFFSTKKVLADLQLMDSEMKDVIGLQPKLFRPPYGVMNPNIKKAIIKGGYIPVGWNVRSMDTVVRDEKKLYDKMVGSIKPGAVFLFHDTGINTLKVLPGFIDAVIAKGFKIVALDKMLNLQPYA